MVSRDIISGREAEGYPMPEGGMEGVAYSGPPVNFDAGLAARFSELLHGKESGSGLVSPTNLKETLGEGLASAAEIENTYAELVSMANEVGSDSPYYAQIMAKASGLGGKVSARELSNMQRSGQQLVIAAKDEAMSAHNLAHAEAHAAHLAAMHDTFYATDSVYRAQTDAITADAQALLLKSDEKQKELDTLADAYGVTTDVDDDVKRLRQQLAATKNPIEARRIQTELAQAQVEQNKARGDILEQRGETQGAAKFRKEDKPLEGAFGKAMELLQEQRTVFLQAQERSMAGKSKEEIEAALQESKNMFAEEDKSLLKSRNVEQVNDFKVRLKERPATLEEPTKGVVIPAAVGVELTPATQETSLKFPTATASLAALPPPSPMGGKKSGPGTGAGTGMVIT